MQCHFMLCHYNLYAHSLFYWYYSFLITARDNTNVYFAAIKYLALYYFPVSLSLSRRRRAIVLRRRRGNDVSAQPQQKIISTPLYVAACQEAANEKRQFITAEITTALRPRATQGIF